MPRLVLLFSCLLAGCYSPKLGSPGFYCHPEDVPACPDGQTCIDGRCYTSGSGPVGGGVGSGGSEDLGANGKPHDQGTPGSPQPDLAQSSLPDLKSPPPDLTTSTTPDLASGSCVPTGGDCTYHNNGVCCSKYCVYKTNTCK
jgi:hypothetical protein